MDITVYHADLVEQGPGAMAWYVGVLVNMTTDDAERLGILEFDGSPLRLVQVIPEETLENMAAEYGLDPDDFDALLETLLYLPFVEDPITYDHPKAPHLVRDTAEAREHVLEQVRKVRGTGTFVGEEGRSKIGAAGPRARILADTGAEDPIEVMRREMPRSKPHIAVRRQLFEERRAQVLAARSLAQARLAVSARTARVRETPEQLRARLRGLGPTGGTRD